MREQGTARPRTAAAAVPIGTVNRFDWTYRSTRPIGGDASTTRITAPPRSLTPHDPHEVEGGPGHVRGGDDAIPPGGVGRQRAQRSVCAARSDRRRQVLRVPHGHHERTEVIPRGLRGAVGRSRGDEDELARGSGRIQGGCELLGGRGELLRRGRPGLTGHRSEVDRASPSGSAPPGDGANAPPKSWSVAPASVMTRSAAPPCCASARKPGVASRSASPASSIVASRTSRSPGPACAAARGIDNSGHARIDDTRSNEGMRRMGPLTGA